MELVLEEVKVTYMKRRVVEVGENDPTPAHADRIEGDPRGPTCKSTRQRTHKGTRKNARAGPVGSARFPTVDQQASIARPLMDRCLPTAAEQ